jgi:hypothetical protein
VKGYCQALLCRLSSRLRIDNESTWGYVTQVGDAIKQAHRAHRLFLGRLAHQLIKDNGTPMGPPYPFDQVHSRRRRTSSLVRSRLGTIMRPAISRLPTGVGLQSGHACMACTPSECRPRGKTSTVGEMIEVTGPHEYTRAS